MKKNLIIFFVIVLGLMFFSADSCLALNEPENLYVVDVGEAQATLQWEWYEGGEGTIKQFKLLYKSMNSTIWIARYPVAESGIIEYTLGGLSEATTYQWRVKVAAQDPSQDSTFVEGPPFTTIVEAPPPPPPPRGKTTVVSLESMQLKNPLAQDTLWGALDAVLNFLILACFVIVPLLIIYAGYLMVLSGGDETKIARGKDIIFWTVMAVAIVVFAKALPAIVKGVFF